jgi:hypothetical protein
MMAGRPLRRAEAEAGAMKATAPPAGSAVFLAVALTTSRSGKVVLILALWLLPLQTARVKPCDPKTPTSVPTFVFAL